MKNILIVNLKRFGDVFTTAHIVNSYVTENPNNKVSLLVFKEFERAAKNIANVDQVFTIDREKFLTFSKNKIFSNAFSLEKLFKDLQDIKSKDWDHVFNYSNDRVSTHLCSFFKPNATNTIGLTFNSTCSIEYSSEWDIVFNDVLTSYKYSPINFVDTYHKMANLNKAKRSTVLKTNDEHNKAAFTNLSQIRKGDSDTEQEAKKIIGIQITASATRKELRRNELISLIDEIAADERYCPVLLMAPTEREREIVRSINSEFNDSLISIEADFLALNSVLMNLDLLITPDTAVKHAADLLNTPTIELSLAEAPLFKQGATNEDSIILSKRVDHRYFTIKEWNDHKEHQYQAIKHTDILMAVEFLLEGKLLDTQALSSDITVYQPVADKLGTRLEAIAGFKNSSVEINRLLGRQFINHFFGQGEDNTIFFSASHFSKEDTTDWLNESKELLTNFTKDLLGTLRSLLQSKDNSKEEFVGNLAGLLEYCEGLNIASIPAIIFRARLEVLNTQDLDSSIKEIEGLLYELKGDLQKLHKTIKSFEEFIFTKGKEDRMSSRRGPSATI